MQLIKKDQNRRGIAMTEYLIILAIVAIAAIAVVGLFGKQIKSAFTSSTDAMAGESTANESSADTSKNTQDDMGSFTKDASAE